MRVILYIYFRIRFLYFNKWNEVDIPGLYALVIVALCLWMNINSVYLISHKLYHKESPHLIAKEGVLVLALMMLIVFILIKNNHSKIIMDKWVKEKRKWKKRGNIVLIYVICTISLLILSVYFSLL